MSDDVRPVNGQYRFTPTTVEVALSIPRPPCPGEAPAEPPPAARTHSRDFTSVRWDGELYTFTRSQALVVAALWQAWKNGTPYVHQAELMAAADSDGTRLLDLFRGPKGKHPAWGTMIVAGWLSNGPEGTYRLKDGA